MTHIGHKNKSFIKNNIISLAGHILIYLQGIILMPILIRIVGVSVYGGYTLLLSILGFVFGISSLGVGFKCARYLPSSTNSTEKQKLVYSQLNFQLITLAGILCVFIILNNNINKVLFKDKIEYTLTFAIIYLCSYLIYSQTNNYIRYTNRITQCTIQSVIYIYSNIIFIISTFYFTHLINIDYLLLTQSFSALLVSLPVIYLMYKEIGFTFYLDKVEQIYADLKLGLPIVFSYVVDIVLSIGDRYIIALYFSVTEVGYYNPGYTLGTLIILFPKSLGMVLPQALAKYVDQNDEVAAQKLIDYSIRYFLLVAIPYIVASGIMSRQLLTLLASEEVAREAYLVTPVVALATLFYGINIIMTNILFVRLKTKAIFNLNLMAALLNVVLNVVIFYFVRNIVVAAVTTLVTYFVVFVYMYRLVKYYWIIRVDINVIIKNIISATIMGACILLLTLIPNIKQTSVIYLLLEVLTGVTVYFVATLLLGTVSKNELQYFKTSFFGVTK